MTYEKTLQYLYTSTPVYQHSGTSAYKPGLDTSIALDDYLGNPHKQYKTIHVGGTNGKGSVCHMLAAILQEAGYKVGLYTSPHLVDFRERICINGQMIPKDYVVSFVEKNKPFFEPLHPSFFELTSSMAFSYFRDEKVDFAIIEVGLGGRLDSTNIITPIVSIITNISLDHTHLLGESLGEIAYEKAGIIKKNVPVVIGEMNDSIVETVFRQQAKKMNAPLYNPTEENVLLSDAHLTEIGEWHFDSADYGMLTSKLNGLTQFYNVQTVLTILRVLTEQDIAIPQEAIRKGIDNPAKLTGLKGRWQEVLSAPYTILDTGHNIGAWIHLKYHIEETAKNHPNLYMIIGFSKDKDIDQILEFMPKKAQYLFTQASTDRSFPAQALANKAAKFGLKGREFSSVAEAVMDVMQEALDEDMIFIGGSNFIVADALPLFEDKEDGDIFFLMGNN